MTARRSRRRACSGRSTPRSGPRAGTPTTASSCGSASPRAQVLRSSFDGERLRSALLEGGPLAVVGAGLIGLEAAAAARALGVEVTVIEAAPRPVAGGLRPAAPAPRPPP